MLTDVVNGSSTEFAIKLFGAEASQVMNGVGPEVQHVVPGEGVPLLDHHHPGAHQSELDGGAQAARTSSDDEALKREGEISVNFSRHGGNFEKQTSYERKKKVDTLAQHQNCEGLKEGIALLLL